MATSPPPKCRKLRRKSDGAIKRFPVVAAARMVKKGTHEYADGKASDVEILKNRVGMKELTRRDAPVVKTRNIPFQEKQPPLQKKHKQTAAPPKRTPQKGGIEMQRLGDTEIGERTDRKIVKTSEIPPEQMAAIRANNIESSQMPIQATQSESLKDMIQRTRTK